MRLIPVALSLFYRLPEKDILEVWVQVRTDDGPFHGLLEFPGGGIEPGESPVEAAVREVQEEVGITINAAEAKLMGTYSNIYSSRTILLYVFLFPESADLAGRGQWLRIDRQNMSSKYKDLIPGPNHQMIDDLYRHLYDAAKDDFSHE